MNWKNFRKAEDERAYDFSSYIPWGGMGGNDRLSNLKDSLTQKHLSTNWPSADSSEI